MVSKLQKASENSKSKLLNHFCTYKSTDHQGIKLDSENFTLHNFSESKIYSTISDL